MAGFRFLLGLWEIGQPGRLGSGGTESQSSAGDREEKGTKGFHTQPFGDRAPSCKRSVSLECNAPGKEEVPADRVTARGQQKIALSSRGEADER